MSLHDDLNELAVQQTGSKFETIASYNGDLAGTIRYVDAAMHWYPERNIPACIYVDKERRNGKRTGLVKMTIYIDTQE